MDSLKRVHVLFLGMTVVLVAGCNQRDKRFDLPCGYSLFSPHSQRYVISSPDSRVVIFPQVVNVGWRGAVIFGKRVNNDDKHHPLPYQNAPFFIIDAKAGTVDRFYKEIEFQSFLKQHGIGNWQKELRWKLKLRNNRQENKVGA